jgi:hypothetical protein
MGLTQKLGTIPLAILTDASNNVGIGAAPSGSYKLEVTGTAKVSSTLLLGGALTGTSATFSGKVGIGATPYTSTTAIIRAVSATSTNYALIIEDNASNQLFEIKNNGAATFSSTVTTLASTTNGFIAQTTANSVYPYFRWVANNRSYWAAAIDNGSDAPFSIGNGNTIGSSILFTLTPSNNTATFSGSVTATTGTLSTAYNGGSVGQLHITSSGTEGGTITFEKTSGTAQKYKFGLGTTSLFIYNETAGNQPFTLTSGGDVYIGNPSISTSNTAIFLQKSGIITTVRAYSSGTIPLVEFYKQSAGDIGSISYNGTITLYNASSDYRLKEDLKDYNGLEIVSKLKTYDFKWKEANVRDYGMMAHELQEVLPNYVSGEKDAIKEDGSIKVQGVDYSKIVPILVKAIQEQNQTIQELNERLNKAGL